MADVFNELKAKAERVEKDIDEIYTSIDSYKEKLSSMCRETKEEVDKLLQTSLSSPEKWTEDTDKQAEIIKRVNEDLPNKVKMMKEALAQAASGLVIGTKEARSVTIAGVILLLIMIGVYIPLHYCPKVFSYNKDSAKEFFSAIGKIKASVIKPNVDPKEVSQALNTFGNKENDLLNQEFAERISFLKGFVSTFAPEASRNPNSDKQTTDKPSVKPNDKHVTDKPTELQQTDQRVVVIKEEIEKIEKEARALSRNDGFFWITGYWRWLEIVFWGEFGVIVGILAWVCTQVEAGKYTKGMYERERYWYLAEVIIGPVVVAAVFFLLKQFIGTMMTGIAEEEVRGSIYLTMGISFSLGLFIRRTLGIFDYIKEKLPLPKS